MENTEITVIIPPEEKYSVEIYTDASDCYLAKALKKAGYEEVYVGPWGNVSINGKEYSSKTLFHSKIIAEAFKKQEELTIVLTQKLN